MNYKKAYTPREGYTPLCEIGKCSLKNLEFGILELKYNGEYTFETRDREVAFVLLGGSACFTAKNKRRRTAQQSSLDFCIQFRFKNHHFARHGMDKFQSLGAEQLMG